MQVDLASSSMMDVEVVSTPSPVPATAPALMSTLQALPISDSPLDSKAMSPEPIMEPDFFTLGNLSRVTPFQLPLIAFPAGGKFQPLHNRWRGEILVVKDCDPTQPAEHIKTDNPEQAENDHDDPAPPPPFKIPDI